jgi:hypothetical protein
MAGSTRTKSIFFGIDDEPTNLYFYKYYWQGDQKVQTSWSKWNLPNSVKVHWAVLSGSFLYILVERSISNVSTALYLERVLCDEDVFNTNTDYEILLDRRTTNVVLSYDAVNDRTTVVTPYSTTATNLEVISSDVAMNEINIRHAVTKLANNEFAVPGDITAHSVTVGVPYTFLYEFSPVYPREARGDGSVVMLDGRLQVRYMTVEYHDTAYFKTTLTMPARDPFVSSFSGITVGDPNDPIGAQSFASGYYRIPVMCKNTDAKLVITNDSPFPSAFGQAEWQGQWVPKSVKRL